MTTARSSLLVLACLLASALCGSALAADFKCDQAARFGFADSLCEPLQTRIAPIVPLSKADLAREASAPDYDARNGDTDAFEIYRQSARANHRAWDNYGAWNPASPVFPRGTFPGGEFSPLKFPPLDATDTSTTTRQHGRPIKH